MLRKVYLTKLQVLIILLFSFSLGFIPLDNPESRLDDFRKIENKAFKVGEKLTFDVNYGFVTAGIAVMHVQKIKRISGRDSYYITFDVNNVPSFDWLYRVRDKYETYLDTEGLFPWRFELFRTAVRYREAAELPDEAYPLVLTTGRMMFHWHTGTMTRRSPKLAKEVPEGYVEISPEDATALEIGESELVRLVSRRGQIEAHSWITRRVPPGIVFVPFHFAESAANVLTIPALDPVAKIPEFKVCAVRLEKIQPRP